VGEVYSKNERFDFNIMIYLMFFIGGYPFLDIMGEWNCVLCGIYWGFIAYLCRMEGEGNVRYVNSIIN
jgi:hypothetical protein